MNRKGMFPIWGASLFLMPFKYDLLKNQSDRRIIFGDLNIISKFVSEAVLLSETLSQVSTNKLIIMLDTILLLLTLAAPPAGKSNNAPSVELPEIITEAPTGEKVYYARSSYGFTPYQDDWFRFGKQVDTTHVLYSDDGYAYLYNPFSGYPTRSYLRCEIEGDQLIAHLPQAIYYDNYGDDPLYYYAEFMYKSVEADGNVKYYTSDTEEVKSISWTVSDNTLTMNNDYHVADDEMPTWPERILAMVDQNGDWPGYGDASQDYTRLYFDPVVPPAGIHWEEYVMVATYEGRIIDVGFDGDDVYLGCFSKRFPDAYIKGTVEGDKIVFRPRQYIGEYSTYFIYFMTGTCDKMGVYLADDLVFHYNPETKEMCADEGTCMILSASTEEVKSIETLENPVICPDDMDRTPQPIHPVPTGYGDYFDGGGYTYVTFYLPNVNPYNAILDTESMYYEISIDGEDPMTFTPEEYFVNEPMTKIPYSFSNGRDIVSTASGVGHVVFFYFFGYDTVSIQLFNEVEDTTYQSPLAVYYIAENRYEVIENGTSKIEQAPVPLNVVSTEYYDLQGRRLMEPAPGINIVKYIMEDESIRVEKLWAK